MSICLILITFFILNFKRISKNSDFYFGQESMKKFDQNLISLYWNTLGFSIAYFY